MAPLVSEVPSLPFWVSTPRERSTLLDRGAPPLASLPLALPLSSFSVFFFSFRRSLILLPVLLSFLFRALSM